MLRPSYPVSYLTSYLASRCQTHDNVSVRRFSSSTRTHEAVVTTSHRRVMSLFNQYGNVDYIGEPMSITEHSMQSSLAALKGGEQQEAQLACLLHDVGHLNGLEAGFAPGMDGCGTHDHEGIGARFLAALGFSDSIAYLTLNHVNAKRYLCGKNPQYMAKLSEASKTTLKHQGGAMSLEQCAAVERDPRWKLVLRMRGYDETGKDPNAPVVAPESFSELIKTNLQATLAQTSSTVSPYASCYVLSEEQLRCWDQNGYLVIKNAFPLEVVQQLPTYANEIASLSTANRPEPNMVENFTKFHTAFRHDCVEVVQAVVSQACREPAVLLQDKLSFKGLQKADQDAVIASARISAIIAIDIMSADNGGALELELAAGRKKEGHVDANPNHYDVMCGVGDVVVFHPHHICLSRQTNNPCRLAHLTFK